MQFVSEIQRNEKGEITAVHSSNNIDQCHIILTFEEEFECKTAILNLYGHAQFLANVAAYSPYDNSPVWHNQKRLDNFMPLWAYLQKNYGVFPTENVLVP